MQFFRFENCIKNAAFWRNSLISPSGIKIVKNKTTQQHRCRRVVLFVFLLNGITNCHLPEL